MVAPTTYNPASLTVAYRPNLPAWSLPLLVALVSVPPKMAVSGVLAQPSAVRSAYVGIAYKPQAVPVEIADEPSFEEVCLPAMPVRRYRVKAKIRSIEKGRLSL